MREQRYTTQLNQENNICTNKKFNQETEIIKKNQTEMLEQNNTMTELQIH